MQHIEFSRDADIATKQAEIDRLVSALGDALAATA